MTFVCSRIVRRHHYVWSMETLPQEMLEVEDPEFMVGLGRRLPKRPRFLSLGLAFLAVLIVPAAIYCGETGI